MSIYTKTGDRGTTSLFRGTRVSKADPQVDAYGSLDELSSALGFVVPLIRDKKDIACIHNIQNDLYTMMATLAGATHLQQKTVQARIKLFEKMIDRLDQVLPKLTSFILPGGGEIAARLHLGRTVCRRAERALVSYFDCAKTKIVGEDIMLAYINRLSDLLFQLARKYSTETIAVGKKHEKSS